MSAPSPTPTPAPTPTRRKLASPTAATSAKTPAVGRSTRAARLGARATRLAVWLGLALLVVAVLYPLLWMVFSSFKSNQEVFASPWGLPGELRWGNFGRAGSAGVVRYFVNSVLVTSASILTTVLFSAWAAYGLVRLRVPFGGTILGLLLGGLMLAPTVALIPLFGLLQRLHIYDSYWALIVLYTAFRIPFTTFLIRAYMIDIPSEVDEAATLDGCSPTQAFWQVILPMCRPILVSAALLQALFAWNEFVFALVFISTGDLKTLPVGLMDMQSRLLTDWPVQFAGLTMAALPMIVLFLIGQRQFLRGLTDGIGK
ncbi:carbohydrate ABC transporter permease [Phycicoccus sp. Soil802]|uniref:carbohydrate ABC transporter permease n=1 Tax=Phycicoccus sp. Soil802 TaxID=1736414 RepID=UPI001910D76A|nr:carbohydrate ABC transporter permease [Phycicoccus sp. Soil802]